MYAKKNKPMYGNGGMAKLAQYMEGGVSDPVKGSNPSMSPLANQAAKYETPQYGDPRKIDRNLQELISILRRNSEQDPETVAVFNELMGKANSLRDSYPGGGYNKDWDDQHGQFYSDLFYAGLQNPESGIGRLVDGKVVEQRRRGVPSYKNGGKVVSYGKVGKTKYKKGGFPDLTGDGKVTKADILKGRGVGERKKKRAIRKITRKALNSATSEKKRMDQADLERQNKVKGTKNLLNSLGKYGKGKK